jgi:hypothetical protein
MSNFLAKVTLPWPLPDEPICGSQNYKLLSKQSKSINKAKAFTRVNLTQGLSTTSKLPAD